MTGTLAQIFRHPIKGHGREALASVDLSVWECLPMDRHWAVAHDAARLVPGWNSRRNFAHGAKAPALMAITSVLHDDMITLRHPERGEITFRPDDPTDLPRFLDWVMPLNPPDRALPTRIVTGGQGMTDSDVASASILSLSSLADLSARMGADLSVHRWRGNLWLDGAAPMAEFGWIGKHLSIGGAVLRIEERIIRCLATMANPDTGIRDVDTLAGLQAAYGHQDFGVSGVVVQSGPIAIGDAWSIA